MVREEVNSKAGTCRQIKDSKNGDLLYKKIRFEERRGFMDIRDLKIFQMIASEKSVSKASKKLYMTPQGVSKVLKNLETEMGSQLFVRDKNGMRLTESGECFLIYANQDIEDYYEVKREILHIEQCQDRKSVV